MSDKIARVTPSEIAGMLLTEQALADTRFVLAAEHDAEIERLRALVDVLRWPLAVYIHAHASGSNVPPHIEAAARAALEAKP
jgi:hypothetical protein